MDNRGEISEICSFEIYGKWSVQASKHTNKHTHAHAQCSRASVGLAQAHPNSSLLDSGDTQAYPIAIQVTHTVHSW